MISVGIDVSKEKSTVCILKPYGEIIASPFEITHTEYDFSVLATMLSRLTEEIRIVIESTGNYHLPILQYFSNKGFFVSLINSLVMHKYVNTVLRKGKTDKLDSIKIANYGIDNWYHLTNYLPRNEVYSELQLLGRQYSHFTELKIKTKLSLINILDRTMPGITKLILSSSSSPKDKLCDFAEEYWHFDIITSMSEYEFIESYLSWARKKGYQARRAKAISIYTLAKNGIPTLSSNFTSTKILVLESIKVFRDIQKTLDNILSQMDNLAKTLKEYSIVRNMAGVGDKLAVKLIAEIGDIRRFRNSNALIAFAGIDAPPHQSGNFDANYRRISKRGSSLIRKTGYEVMQSIVTHKPIGDSVYEFILKKEAEGKPKRVAKIAGLNKFLRIYYARVKSVYND